MAALRNLGSRMFPLVRCVGQVILVYCRQGANRSPCWCVFIIALVTDTSPWDRFYWNLANGFRTKSEVVSPTFPPQSKIRPARQLARCPLASPKSDQYENDCSQYDLVSKLDQSRRWCFRGRVLLLAAVAPMHLHRCGVLAGHGAVVAGGPPQLPGTHSILAATRSRVEDAVIGRRVGVVGRRVGGAATGATAAAGLEH